MPRTLPGFEAIRRYRNSAGQLVAKLLPGDFYVTNEDEILDTVLGSCVSACIRNPRLGIGGMNHFMLPRPSGSGNDTWEKVAGHATRYGSASMEQLINRILSAGGLVGPWRPLRVSGARQRAVLLYASLDSKPRA